LRGTPRSMYPELRWTTRFRSNMFTFRTVHLVFYQDHIKRNDLVWFLWGFIGRSAVLGLQLVACLHSSYHLLQFRASSSSSIPSTSFPVMKFQISSSLVSSRTIRTEPSGPYKSLTSEICRQPQDQDARLPEAQEVGG